jgi:dTDP-4-amino-4,6-dideoxygalactose transaminase
MLPGALRLGEREEEAAVEVVRELMRSKNLFPFYGVSADAVRSSRVRELERAFAKRSGASHAVAVNSGTSALVCGLVGLGIGPGDEVIVPGYTWVSTASAVLTLGAVPVIAEVDDSLTLDPEDVRRKISPYTKAIVPVHMRGAPARMDTLVDLARERGLRVLEDACQAAGGSFRGRALGSIGDAGAFSVQMSKIMTAGEGGLLITSDPALRLRATMYQDSAACPDHGVPLEEWLPGVNLRMSELHAAVLLVQLARLDRIVVDMRARKARLKAIVADELNARGIRFRAIHDPAGDTSIALVFFLPDASRAKQVAKALADENVPASRLWQELEHLPHDHIDLHAYPAWAPIMSRRSWTGDGGPWRHHPREVDYSADMCPVTMDLLRRAIHVDVSPDLSDEQVEQTGAAIVHVVRRQI